MRTSPVSLIALAAFAAVAVTGALTQTGAAEDRAQRLRLRPAQTQMLKVETRKPSRPTRKARLLQSRPTLPAGKKLATGQAGGPAPDPSQLADLVVVPYYNNPDGLPEGFPTHSYCVKKPTGGTPTQIRFYIRNVGGSPTGSFQWTPMFPNAGAAPATAIGNIPAYGQVLVTQTIPSGCYTQNYSGICQFSIHLDDHDDVLEASNANNSASSFCVSPAG